MNPCELNAAIAALTNHFYCTLSPRDFNCLTIIFSELSKSMFSMALLRDVCDWGWERERHGGNKEKKEKEKENAHEEEKSDA